MTTFLAALRWQLRPLLWVNLTALSGAIGFTLLWGEALEFLVTPYVILCVALHSAIVVFLLGRNGSRGSRFLYAQGFTRDEIWWSTFSASLLSGIVVCGSVWLILVLGIRAQLQDWLQNPWFPFMAKQEPVFAGWMLLEYILLLPLLHYAWVRARQPVPDSGAGWLICMFGFVMLIWTITDLRHALLEPTLFRIALSGFLLLAGLLTAASRKLHRQVEVRS